MNWKYLDTAKGLTDIIEKSHQQPQVIFKHSTRCSVSSMAKSRLEKAAAPATVDFHLLDLIAHRSISNQITADLKVWHESPQVLLVVKGECIYDESHLGIRMDDILEQAGSIK